MRAVTNNRSMWRLGLAVLCAVALSPSAWAQTFPIKDRKTIQKVKNIFINFFITKV
jgi:hypothetical protein